MRIKSHLVEGIAFERARQIGGAIKPEIVILHDTAGRLDPFNSKDYLKASTKVSVHFVVERDGTITQLVPTNRRAAHAGKSHYHGRDNCNGFSIGIEIVNPGRMSWADNRKELARTWWGELFHDGQGGSDLVEMATPEHGPGVWMSYSAEQLAAVEALLLALFRDIPTLTDITTHWYVSPGRKVDVNPLFPLEELRATVLGRDDPADAAAEEGSEAVPTVTTRRVKTNGATLNVRRWPSFNPNVIGEVPDGTSLPVLREGTFGGRGWSQVLWNGLTGWIVNSPYTEIL